MFPTEVHETISNWLIANTSKDCVIRNIIPSTGGSINEAFRLETSHGDFFLKFNLANLYPQMFEMEMRGLELLARTNTVYIPKVFVAGTSGFYSFLLMRFEQKALPVKGFWKLFAHQLAALHHNKANFYGLEYNNYIGSLNQSNRISYDYIDFFVTERLQPLIKTATDKQFLSKKELVEFERLFGKLNDIIPIENSSLIHGDLWSGNLIINHEGLPCLIDPAVYYGHRESDIAMTKLFGGFPLEFYKSYQEVFPMEQGWEQRLEIHQLYPLLVHVNLFGYSYVSQVKQIINKF